MGEQSENKNGSRTVRKLWIGIGLLILLSPLGIIIPAYFGAGGAWGEWSLQEIEKMTGFAPVGMKRLADTWKAPMTNYAVPGQGQGLIHGGLGYMAAAVIGIAVTAGVSYLLAKALARRDDHAQRK